MHNFPIDVIRRLGVRHSHSIGYNYCGRMSAPRRVTKAMKSVIFLIFEFCAKCLEVIAI